MRGTRSSGLVFLLALMGSTSLHAQTTLNLSQDLVPLGIAATNMVPNQPSLDAGPLFVAGVNYAKTNGITTVVADPGSYYFLSATEPNAHFALRNIDNMTIDLHGADLIFTHPLYYGMIVYYSTNAIVQNFTVDYQPLPFTQVRVVSVDAPNNQIQYVVEPGWQDPSALNSIVGPAGSPPPIVDVHIFRNGRPVLGRLATQLPLSGDRFPVVNTPAATLPAVRVGDVAVIALKGFANALSTNHCTGCLVRGVTVFSAANAGVQTLDSPSSVMERVYSIPKPGTDRLVSTFGLAHQPSVGPNNVIRLSRSIRTMDDGLAYGGRFTGTVRSPGGSQSLIVEGSGGPTTIGDGDTLPNGSPVTFERPSDGVILGSAVIVSQTAPTSSQPKQVTYTFDRVLPSGLLGSVMYTTDAAINGAGSVLERSTVQSQSCCKGLYIAGLANSAIRGNYIRNPAWSGIFLVHATAPGDPPTPPLVNVNVTNNVIDGTNVKSDWWWFQFGSIQSVTLSTAFDLMAGSLFSNINITNNFIADSGRSAVWLGNTSGGSVTGNYLLHSNMRPDLANAYQPRIADATKPLVIDTTSTGMTTANNTIDTTSRVTFITDTAYTELAAYAPGSTMRLNAYNIGALLSPIATLTDADGVVTPIAIQSTTTHALDVQIPSGAALGGAYVTLTSGAAKYFGTLFIDSQDNIPAVNGCTYEASLNATSVASAGGSLSILVVTKAGCSYQAVDSDPFVTGGGATGTAVISVSFAANTGAARSTTIEIAGQPITVTQLAVPAPTITVQPQSQLIASGQTATLSVTATSAAAMTYQWYVGASGNTANPIAGATASSYTTPALTSTTSYWVRVSNGGGSVDSATATISLGASPVITTMLQSQTIASGQTATLNVTATGNAPLTYQWYVGASETTTNPIVGATGTNYTTPALTSTTSYWVRVSNAYPPAANSATATITVGTAPPITMVANGKSLTVTTNNAVATFNGADLVGFVNSLTNETYLKKPSGGELAQVETIASTGQALQPSNWTIGTEPGTGLQLATIITNDSVRTLTLTVKVDPAGQEIVLRSSASVTTPGLRGAAWSIAGMDLVGGRWIVPAHTGMVFDRAHPGLDAYLVYPYSWEAQMAVYEAALGSFLMYSTDGQYYSKRLRQTSRGDSTLDVAIYTEAVAPFPPATTVPAVEWRMKAFAGDWRVAAQPFRDWMLAARPPLSHAAYPWVSDIRTVVMMYGQDTALLAPLAAKVNPSQTLLYLVGWRQSPFGVNFPDYTPGAGAANFISVAHSLGFKVMLHVDFVGVHPNNPDYASMQQYQARQPETLELMGWNWDKPPSEPNRYAVINPAAAAWRSLWIARVGVAVAALNPDALHLDFDVLYNVGNGLVEGRTFAQGAAKFYDEISAAFPGVALGAESETDIGYRYHSFSQAWPGLYGLSPAPGHPINAFLFRTQTQYYGHLGTSRVSDPTFKFFLDEEQRRGVFPMWRVESTADLDASDADNTRFIGMLQSFQSHDFRPAWTADWTGAAVRYQGLSGSTAALTDQPTLLTLTGAGTQLFQLAHDASRVTSGSFINRWPAFDNATLFGLDPTKHYFLDALSRPGTTHATSLPPGVQVGSGTLVSTSFAHFEAAPASVSSFDFIGGMFGAHSGVRFQGVDYDLGNGAVVFPASIVAGGVSRSGIFVSPPWSGQVGGEAFIEYSLPVPAGGSLQFSVAVADNASCTDGVTFRVTVGGATLWQRTVARTGWQNVLLPLTAYGGSTVALRLTSNPGPANNPNCDWALWSGMALVAPATLISVPVTMDSGSVFSGFDGDGSFSPATPLTGTVASLPVPGSFTVFTQPGSTVTSGSNLTTLPFELWQWGHEGELARPGSVFNDGAVGPETSGGVMKSAGIFAHPPNAGRTMLSWVIRLPAATPLKLGWSAGVIDGAFSDDGVDFDVRINTKPYWTLTTGVHGDNHWTAGQLDLSRWQGQSVLVELVTDSRTNWNGDWAAWADLVLSPSSVTCAYGVPTAASVGAFGGSFSLGVTATPTCSWSASSHAPWLTIVSGSGSGSGAANYLVDPNPGPARAGTLTVAGQTVTVTQAGQGAPFSDDPLIAGSSVIRAVHVTELRTRINAVRVQKGLAAYSWTDPGLTSGTGIRAQHFIELRNALAEAYVAAGLPTPTYSTTIGVGATIRVADIQELRAAVVAIE